MEIFDIRLKRHRISCHAWRNPTRMRGYVPQVRYSKNIQGWFYTRYLAFEWSYYAFLIDFTVVNFLDDSQEIAHAKNVSIFGKKNELS